MDTLSKKTKEGSNPVKLPEAWTSEGNPHPKMETGLADSAPSIVEANPDTSDEVLHSVKLNVNGRNQVLQVNSNTPLRDVLRQKLGLTSIKDSCNGYGACGSCTALMNGRTVLSCMVLAAELDIREGIIFERANPSITMTVGRLARAYSGGLFTPSGPFFIGDWTPEPPHVKETYPMNRQALFVEVEVTKLVHPYDVGQSLNPDINEQQLYGAVGCSEAGKATTAAASLVPAVYNAIGKWVEQTSVTPKRVSKALGKA